ncbi:ABC transporter ATP-binding protein [Paenibacillus thiaminolyticus]|uniref:ABC transporter ATP-binding protein n=1 Tax=Paenibacillus thiaminolyticus TaxID=49283 RepID=UPI0011637616|nr:ABC transporter ATP-binding protein [Paenibacillus thiaminolyticus]MDG0873639.1 ABC transporter ATP-binding protein [Paenibacillus thiaminolyticus]NGP58688.1 ABC transporter ATP-binding protein [Paenibacillus thiaminolyticus]WCR26281.1 ABC transporter ATP-binding protein [Paenibacillus thiaminolyticus]
MNKEENIITVKNLSKVYKIYDQPIDRLKESMNLRQKIYHSRFNALKDLSFSVRKGQTVGIIGKNGSGKSTLLKILAGVLSPTEGVVEINGNVAAILELGAGFNLEYSGIDNIYLNGTILGKSKKQIDDKLAEILHFADIGDFIYQPVKTYSSGMFARLAFAVAINVGSDILIVDEALAVGDMKFQTKCFRKFEELKEKGTTILFVGHDISSIRKFCDKTMWLHKGELLHFGDTLTVTAEYMEYMNSEQDEVPKCTTNSVEAIDTVETCLEPINRWGSQVGLISKVFLVNEKGKVTNIIRHGETARVIMRFNMPDKINVEHFSAAISIKNTMGLDLIVFTTHDDNRIFFSEQDSREIELVFEFVNYLTEGEYILVAALEDRSTIQPQYYDFIEGVAFLKSLVNTQLFGIVHTPYRVVKKEDVE